MKILLDTNVVSELMKPAPEPALATWINHLTLSTMHVTSVTKAEILIGIALMPVGKRREGLAKAAHTTFDRYFRDRILPFDSDSAEAFAELAAARRLAGRPISIPDAQIAAIARSHGATLATRNVRDFVDCGITLINPWIAARH